MKIQTIILFSLFAVVFTAVVTLIVLYSSEISRLAAITPTP